MFTELTVEKPVVTAGSKVRVEEFDIRNARMHTPLEKISRLMIAMIESRSNNSSATVSPKEVRAFRLSLQNIVDDFEFSFENDDLPSGSHEMAYKICLPHQKHILAMKNQKLRGCVAELYKVWDAFVTMDSASLETVISTENRNEIRCLLAFIMKVFDREIGSGENQDSVGRMVSADIHVGEIIPGLHSNFCERIEPSATNAAPPIPDVADTESIVGAK